MPQDSNIVTCRCQADVNITRQPPGRRLSGLRYKNLGVFELKTNFLVRWGKKFRSRCIMTLKDSSWSWGRNFKRRNLKTGLYLLICYLYPWIQDSLDQKRPRFSNSSNIAWSPHFSTSSRVYFCAGLVRTKFNTLHSSMQSFLITSTTPTASNNSALGDRVMYERSSSP